MRAREGHGRASNRFDVGEPVVTASPAFVILLAGVALRLNLTHKVGHHHPMRSAAVRFAGLMAIASALCCAADAPSLDPDTATPPSTRLLQTLKHVLDSDQLLQEAFFSDENLRTVFDATSIQWFMKDDDPPHIGKIVIIKSALVPEADIRVSSLFVRGSGKPRRVSIVIRGIHLTQKEVIAVFGPPVTWTRRVDPHGDSIPLPLHFGDVEGVLRTPWDGTVKKGASFSAVPDGSVDGIAVVAIGPDERPN
jgi:hypothetical protein